MQTNRIIRVVVGLALIGYGLYSGVAWFYLGAVPLIMGIINWCPLEMKMGSCDPASGCCASDSKDSSSSCCSQENEPNKSACCTPKADKGVKPTSFKPIPKADNGTTLVEILGTGCSKCITLEKVVNEVIKSLDGEYEVKKVSEIQEIMAYNVVSTPALVINGTVVSTGKLLTADEVKKILEV